MDTLNTLLLGWLVTAVLILGSAKFLYDKFLRGNEEDGEENLSRERKSPTRGEKKISPTAQEKRLPPTPMKEEVPRILLDEPRKKPTIVPSLDNVKNGGASLAAGQDADAVRWVDSVTKWLYRGPHGAISGPYLRLLNEMTVQTALETGVLIEVVEVLPSTPTPLLTNLVVDCSPDDSMNITCDCKTSIYLRLQATRTHGEVTNESEYVAAIDPFIGRVNADLKPHQLKARLKFDGWPEVPVELEGIRNNEVGLGEKELQEVIKEVVASAVRTMVLDLHMEQEESFPRFKRSRDLPEKVMPVGYDSMAQTLVPAPPPPGLAILNGKRLLVKIVKATGVGCEKSLVNGYVVVEMDEPAQKFQTGVIEGTNSPLWDEQFLFDLSDSTLELLFEVYDDLDSSFLGLGIVGIEELVATPSQRQIIPLQARPYEDDKVSGSLTVEFLFLEGGDLPELSSRKIASVQLASNVKGDTVTTTYTRDQLTQGEPVMINGHSSVADAALKDLTEKNISLSPSANKSTLIIHSSKTVARMPSGEYAELEESYYYQPEEEEEEMEVVNLNDEDDSYVVNTLQYPSTNPQPTKTVTTISSSSPNTKVSSISNESSNLNDTVDESSCMEDDGRGRSRNKKKSFFGTLKKRFSRSKQRSQSMQPSNISPSKRESTPADAPRTATVGRSVSMERSQRLRPTGLLSVPKSNSMRTPADHSGPRSSDTGSTRSSLSEASGLSSSSTRTYVNEASMLIVETVENGVVRHYLVPVSLQQRNKWRKRGTKLHVYGGHTFVAKHISSSTKCPVCSKNFNRRPGKQGYECRDCLLVTHKPCHVKTEEQCPNSKVNNMDLIYIQDPREERKKRRP